MEVTALGKVCASFVAIVLLPASAVAKAPSTPQANLPTVSLQFGELKLSAEVADEEMERQAGMMFRRKMADGEGMVFVFESPRKVSFWMKNTLIPLSVAYVNRNGMILEIHDLQPEDETVVSSKFDSILYAIEVPQGWFQKNSILPGSTIEGLPPAPPKR